MPANPEISARAIYLSQSNSCIELQDHRQFRDGNLGYISADTADALADMLKEAAVAVRKAQNEIAKKSICAP